nr:MAG TPA: hypothetical protein [Caudoviricetes sp.]
MLIVLQLLQLGLVPVVALIDLLGIMLQKQDGIN